MEHIRNRRQAVSSGPGRKAGRGGSRAAAQGRGAGGPALSGSERKLLQALAGAGAFGVPEAGAAMVSVRTSRRGVTLPGGRHRLATAEALVRRDLAAWRCGAQAQSRTLLLSDAGRAHLGRLRADPADEPFVAQHLPIEEGTVMRDGRIVPVRLDAEESPLDWLRRRRGRDGAPLIDAASYEAGERLRRDLTLGAMLPGVTARWDAAAPARPGPGAAGPAAATEAALAARQRATRALEAVGGELADLLLDLCGFLKGLETIERERRWPARSGKVAVGMALARLADHYGLRREARGPARSRGVTGWRDR